MWSAEIRAYAGELRAAGRSPNTIRLRTYWIHRLQLEVGADADPWEVTRDQLVAWLGNDIWSPETRKSARASVRVFYRWAVETGRLPEAQNPAAHLPVVNVPRATPRPAPDSVFARALREANDRERLFLLLAGYQGMRREEIARFHPDNDIDRDRNMLRVHGKGGRVRNVPLHPVVLAAVDAELARRRAGRVGSGFRYQQYVTARGYMFPGRAGHVGADVPGRVLARLLGEDWTGHTLRHRFATAAYAAEQDLRAVQELLGHSRPETTARYTAVPDGAMQRAVLAVGLTAPAMLHPVTAA